MCNGNICEAHLNKPNISNIKWRRHARSGCWHPARRIFRPGMNRFAQRKTGLHSGKTMDQRATQSRVRLNHRSSR